MVSGKASSLGATRTTLTAVTAVDMMATFHIFVPMTCLPPSRSLSSRVCVLMLPATPSMISRSKNPWSPQILRLKLRPALHLQMTLRRCPLLSRYQVLSDLVGALLCFSFTFTSTSVRGRASKSHLTLVSGLVLCWAALTLHSLPCIPYTPLLPFSYK